MFKSHRNLIKFICIFFVSVIISIIMEIFCFNFSALKDRYSLWVPAENCNIQRQEDITIMEYQFDEITYVKKIALVANVENSMAYTVNVTYVNNFDVQKIESIDDVFLWTNHRHYTVINEEVKSIQIVLSGDAAYVESVGFLNELQVNKYRIIVIFSIIFILGNIVFLESFYYKKIEYLFLIIGLLAGGTMIILQGTAVMGWDEEVHFELTHAMNFRNIIEQSISTETITRATVLPYDTLEEKEQTIQYFNQNAEYLTDLEKYKDNNAIPYNQWGYFAQALFYRLGNALQLGFNQCYMMGRLGNLLLYVFMLFIAIKIAKTGKMIIMGIALMPTPLFLATTYTYDSFVFAFLVLGFVLLYNQLLNAGKMDWYIPLLIIFFFAIGSMPKAVYIPIILLTLLLVKKSKTLQNRYYNMILILGVVFLFLLIMSTFVLPTATNTIANNVNYGGDSRGGNTSAVLQLMSILKHPVVYIKILFKNILSFDNFRNFGAESLDKYLSANLCFLNVGKYGTMPDKYVYLLIPYLVLMVCWGKSENLNKKIRIISMSVFAIIIILVWTALYLAFTPVGEEEILGVQARYYLPIIIPIMLIMPVRNISAFGENLKDVTKRKILLCISWFFLSYCIYFFVFKTSCL